MESTGSIFSNGVKAEICFFLNFGSPVFGSPVFGSPVFGSPVFGSLFSKKR
jgi:hypothetical protein